MNIKKAFLSIISLGMLFSLLSCGEENYKVTKIAVFADNQLSYAAGGGTAFADIFLKNHLSLCKEKNVDVIVINGDLVNNAVSSYYTIFESSLKEVYGNEENYPEFVYTMGNHEWYTNTSSEYTDANAISLFKKHARINTSALRKKSQANVSGQRDDICADYYKVINGIPFVSISGSSSSGLLSYTEREEIKSWLQEISNLPRVKSGCPIYVSYHYAIEGLTYTFGQGAAANSIVLDELLRDYSQVVLFSGDTHFAAANERTINQVNYTNINLGSSSYTRHVNRSVTMGNDEEYYNLATGHGSKDTLTGEVAVGYNNTPHIHLIEVDESGNATYKRHFSNSDISKTKQLGLSWHIPNKVTKDIFEYTNDRFENESWANKMYNKNGLSWKEDEMLSYELTSTSLKVKFNDVTDYNYCEHYQIKVEADTIKTFNFITHYYKWEDNPHSYNYEISTNHLPSGNIKSITVKAFDFFDNPSLNSLTYIA